MSVVLLSFFFKIAGEQFAAITQTNLELTDIVTPIQVNKYHRYLREAGFDEGKTEVLVSGFRHGFDIGYRGLWNRRNTSSNIPIRVGSIEDMWSKLMREVEVGHHAGPFTHIPFDNYVQSPIGLVPKSGNKTRLIFHLAYDFDPENWSINHHTPQEWCHVKYNDLDYAIRTCLHLVGKAKPSLGTLVCDGEAHYHQHGEEFQKTVSNISAETKFTNLPMELKVDITEHVLSTIYMAKSDLMSAFRILPILPKQRRVLISKCICPGTQQYMYFVEKNLPFGSSISCTRFQLFSDSLKCLIEFAMGQFFTCTNYLDDYMFISKEEQECNDMVRSFLTLCHNIGCPVALDKTEWASTTMVFLGILLNGVTHTLSIPEDKRVKALTLTNFAIQKKKVTVKFVQQLTGTLNFINRAIVPGRAFTRGMYDKLKLKDKRGNQLKQYHHVNLNDSFITDCQIWKLFLENATATELCRPFVDVNQYADAHTLYFYSDASLHQNLGMGAVYRSNWIAGCWGSRFILQEKPSIEFLELFALVAAILTWGHHSELTNTRVIISCDNQATLHMVNNLASSCPKCMKLIQILTLNNLQFNRRVFV